jgi:hypothetical protein
MNDCCAATPGIPVGRCPACGAQGRPVARQTVKALLRPAALVRLETAPHRFCAGQTCDVVYFDDEGRTFLTAEVEVAVWQKAPAGDRPLCYCFGETEATIRRELATTGRSTAVERVRAHIASGRCACEIRNPNGACCLGDLIAAVARGGGAN